MGRAGGPTWMSGPQSTLSGVVSLWVSERPSVMTSATLSFPVGGSSRSRVYCRASPVNVPPAIHRSFLTALWGGALAVSAGAGLQGRAEAGDPWGPRGCGRPGTRHSLLELLEGLDARVPQVHVLLHLVVAVLHHTGVGLPGRELHASHAPVRRRRGAPGSPPSARHLPPCSHAPAGGGTPPPGPGPFPARGPHRALLPGTQWEGCLTLTSSSLLSRSRTLMTKSLAISKFCRPMLSELSSTKRMSMGPHLHSAGKDSLSPGGLPGPHSAEPHPPDPGPWGFWPHPCRVLGEDGAGQWGITPAPTGNTREPC